MSSFDVFTCQLVQFARIPRSRSCLTPLCSLALVLVYPITHRAPLFPNCLENRIFWVTKVTVCKTMGWVGGGGLVEGYLSRVFGLWAFWVPLRVFLKKNLNETNQLLQRLSFSFSCLCCLVLLVLFRKMISFQFSVALLVTVRFVRFRFWNTQKFVLQSVQTST